MSCNDIDSMMKALERSGTKAEIVRYDETTRKAFYEAARKIFAVGEHLMMERERDRHVRVVPPLTESKPLKHKRS